VVVAAVILGAKMYTEKFKQYMKQNFPTVSEEEVQTTFFTDYDGCIPIEYISDDLLLDIETKFFYLLSFVRSLVKCGTDVKITIMPSYSDMTIYTVSTEAVVLEDNGAKAWNLKFPDSKEFDKWIIDRLQQWTSRLKWIVITDPALIIDKEEQREVLEDYLERKISDSELDSFWEYLSVDSGEWILENVRSWWKSQISEVTNVELPLMWKQ
jgi:hypothetical protein